MFDEFLKKVMKDQSIIHEAAALKNIATNLAAEAVQVAAMAQKAIDSERFRKKEQT